MSKPNHDSLLRWLSPLRSSQRHRDLRLNRIADVSCSWLDNPEFLRWRDADNSEEVLFCSGKSGSGLTTLTFVHIPGKRRGDGGRTEREAANAIVMQLIGQSSSTISMTSSTSIIRAMTMDVASVFSVFIAIIWKSTSKHR